MNPSMMPGDALALSPEIVGIGRCTLDILFRLPEGYSWTSGGAYEEYSIDGGGQVGTALVAASKLGASTGFIGTAGSDQAAELKLGSLREWGVDTSKVVRRDGPDSSVILVTVHGSTGERSFTHSHRLDTEPVEPRELDREYITSAKYLHLDGSHPDAALTAAQWMKQSGGTVMLDGSRTTKPIPEPVKRLIQYVDVLICGEGFAQQLTGEEDPVQAGKTALGMGPRVFVQTLGDRGSVTVTDDDSFTQPAFNVEVKDTTGAGDVFHGAYLYGLLRGWTPRYNAVFSTAVSALKCTRMGGRKGAPRLDEVHRFLAELGIEPQSDG